ncbi:MAG: hypothetical protein FJY75_03210 [Candidatus Eisenbacteria bacterium]|uniref:Uncharacterized protein n=1 Tax=Eiseniibacteriota bacterium TaxID=2212470 RepID=A0A937X7Y3_UNCEI|nr:hypothetical protein [Candidatus Eisenbacteria bacterium]
MSQLIGVWVAAFLTLCIFSFLYRDNPFFRFAESLFAGVSLGYYIGIVAVNTLVPNLINPLFGDFGANAHLLIPLLLGLNLYTRFIPRIAWLARISLAVYIAYYIGINMVQKIQGEIVPQVGSTILHPIGGVMTPVDNLILIVGVLAVLIYFYFSIEHRGAVGAVSRLGVWFLMLGFGAAFGYTVMGRVSLLIGRMNFLFIDLVRITGQAL